MTTDDIMALANKYAASNGKALLEKLYGTSQSYTEQCTAEAFQDRQALRAAIETLRYEVDAIAAIKEERDALQASLVEARKLLEAYAKVKADDEALMRQALEALELSPCSSKYEQDCHVCNTITALRTRLSDGANLSPTANLTKTS